MKKRLLVIDDEQLVLDSIQDLLMFEDDIDLVTVLGATEGVKVWQSQRPDLTLLDLRMPDVDGILALQAMQAVGSLEASPVVVLSGHVTHEEIEACRESGALDVWKKPLNMELLFAFITGLDGHGL